jgi:hypothetical protein
MQIKRINSKIQIYLDGVVCFEGFEEFSGNLCDIVVTIMDGLITKTFAITNAAFCRDFEGKYKFHHANCDHDFLSGHHVKTSHKFQINNSTFDTANVHDNRTRLEEYCQIVRESEKLMNKLQEKINNGDYAIIE